MIAALSTVKLQGIGVTLVILGLLVVVWLITKAVRRWAERRIENFY